MQNKGILDLSFARAAESPPSGQLSSWERRARRFPKADCVSARVSSPAGISPDCEQEDFR
jgi:hypothetical protein